MFQHSNFCVDFHRGTCALLSPHHLWLIENSSPTFSFSDNNGKFIYFRNFCPLLKFPLFLNYCFLSLLPWFSADFVPLMSYLLSCVLFLWFPTFKNAFLSPSVTLHSVFQSLLTNLLNSSAFLTIKHIRVIQSQSFLGSWLLSLTAEFHPSPVFLVYL